MRLSAVILAAGLGTRMKSSVPKVLHRLYDKAIIQWVVEAVTSLRPERTVVVIGSHTAAVKGLLGNFPCSFAFQKEPLGTGHALRSAASALKGFEGTVLVISGDTPLVKTASLKRFLALHRRKREDLSLISFVPEGSHCYGRIVRDGTGLRIVEHRDASESQKAIREVNSGIYAVRSDLLGLLRHVARNESKGEYYLTDLVGLASEKGFRVGAHVFDDPMQFIGINTREDLEQSHQYVRESLVSHWMAQGVTFFDAARVLLYPDTRIGADTTVYPNVCLGPRTEIGSGCVVYPNTRVTDSRIGNGVTIMDSTVIESSEVREGATVGPFARLRPGSVIGPSAKIGNFVEVKKSVIGAGTKASHLSYLGDAEIGEKVNIGAGTITCNYDGQSKHKTVIEDGAFIGSDTQFVAPVTVGAGAYVGAGSTITRDVPPRALGVSRASQRNIEGWVAGRSAREGKKSGHPPSERGKRRR
jgi:bifunctional UDP-N-acetylglucosamine pyrophosphorylase/glucosamine-1-phosphate N-acetyltransferase